MTVLSDVALGGRVILVTGAASGIGHAVAINAAQAGAHVIALDLAPPDATVAAIVRAGGDVTAFALDVGDAAAWRAAVERVLADHGRIDGLANVAGVAAAEDSILTQTDEGWDRILRANLRGAWYGMRAVLPAMLEAGSGRIVNVTSTAALTAMPGSFAYATSKAGLIGMTRQVAIEFADKGIRVNAVAPGIVHTPMLGEAAEASVNAMRAATPIGRIGRPEEVADIICYLLTDSGDFVTGQVMVADGGWVAR